MKNWGTTGSTNNSGCLGCLSEKERSRCPVQERSSKRRKKKKRLLRCVLCAEERHPNAPRLPSRHLDRNLPACSTLSDDDLTCDGGSPDTADTH